MESKLLLPVEWDQLERLVKQLSEEDKMRLHKILLSTDQSKVRTQYASEATLSKEWLLQEEEEAWKNL